MYMRFLVGRVLTTATRPSDQQSTTENAVQLVACLRCIRDAEEAARVDVDGRVEHGGTLLTCDTVEARPLDTAAGTKGPNDPNHFDSDRTQQGMPVD